MPDHIKSLIVIVFIASVIFTLAKPAIAPILPKGQFERYRNLWFAITLIAFLAHNFWLYIIASATVIFLAQRKETNPVALYFALLFAVPPVKAQISGFGILEHLIELNHVRLLELFILLPTYIILRAQKNTLAFGRAMTDKLLFSFMILTIALQLRETTVTNTLRFGFYTFIDVFLPYYVVSRSLRDINQFKVAIGIFVMASLVLAGVAIIEYLKTWLLYSALYNALNVQDGAISAYLLRGGALRASVTTGQAIVLGYVVMVAIGFFLFIRQRIHNRLIRNFLLTILSGGSFAAASRGPWVGILVFLVIFIVLGLRPITGLSKLTTSGVLAIVLALVLPGGEKLIDLLPFVGNIDSANVDYRERLLENGLIVFQQNPILGSATYLETPEMESMKQGQGIIDIVNSYLGILLEYGLVGLGLYISIFASILWGIYKILRRFKSRRDEHYLLGVTILAALIANLTTIFTVSSISFIPVIYWALAGMGAAYIHMPKLVNRRAILSIIPHLSPRGL